MSMMATQPRCLMVKPSEFYFKPLGKDFEDCLLTWSASKRAFRDIGFQVSEYNSEDDFAPRSPYPRDKYLLIEGKIFLPDSAAIPQSTSNEVKGALKNDNDFFSEIMKEYNADVVFVEGIWFEAGNFIVDHEEKTIFGGIHTMDDLNRFKQLESVFDHNLSPAWRYESLTMAPGILKKPENSNSHWFYHLDLAQSERLNGDTVMYCADAFTHASKRKLERHFNGALMPVSIQDAKAGAVNAVANDENVVTTAISDQLVSDLEDRGLKAVDPRDYGVENFMLVDGGARCIHNVL